MDPILSQLNLVNILKSYFFKTNFIIILPQTLSSKSSKVADHVRFKPDTVLQISDSLIS